MSILSELSSQVGDRTQASNQKVVLRCLEDPTLLNEVANGLSHTDPALLGDCAEVLTQVAEQQPRWIAPFADTLINLLQHKTTRVRWEAMHALALAAAYTPHILLEKLPTLSEIIHQDASIIVRDYAIDALGSLAGTSSSAAQLTFPFLKESLSLWNGRHAGHALQGLTKSAPFLPEAHADLLAAAEEFAQSSKAVIRKAAAGLRRSIQN